jgi:hypothetical protein
MSDRSIRLTGLYAATAAIAAVGLSPLLALSYFSIGEGADELENATVRAWADPARDVVGGLLTWASPERVYATYVQAFALLFPAVFLCARAVRARRFPGSGTERWGWRIALTGYGLTGVGLVLAAFALIPGSADSTPLNIVFLAMLLPGMFVSAVGSTVLGIALLRSRYTPRLTPWLLTLAFPSMVVVPTVLGHNSLGMLALMLAWGATGWRLWRTGDPAPAAELATIPASAH